VKKISLVSDMAEWLEGSDYFNFIRIVESELKGYFGNVQVSMLETAPHGM